MKYLSKNKDELIKIMVNNLIETNWNYGVYIDWNNINIHEKFQVELSAMNCLVRNNDFDNTFKLLLSKCPTVITAFPLLCAVKKLDRKELFDNKIELKILNENTELDEYNFSLEKAKKGFNDDEISWYYNFFVQMGLKDLCLNLLEISITDYVIGVLVGMDTNGRKNRSGNSFEALCEGLILDIAQKRGINVVAQKRFDILSTKGFEISEDISRHKADFILRKGDKLLNIEVDFFNAGGSKPEEIVESYINRKNDLEKNNIDFILITDGMCWDNKEKSQLKKAFRYLSIMNFYMAKDGYLEELIDRIFR